MKIKDRPKRVSGAPSAAPRWGFGSLVGAVILTLCVCGPLCAAPDVPWPAETGAPRAYHANLKRIDNDGFSIGYDTARQRAAWVAYRLTPVLDFDHRPRPAFTADPRLDNDAPTRVYAGPRYDRGHLAPNYAISQLYGERAQRQTFYYSNIVPQRPRLNQLDWQRLEEIEIDDIAPQVDTLWVLVGPLPGADGAAPVAFFRIWLARGERGAWQVLAFRLPQTVRGDERLDRFIASVDAIEAATGLDFLPGLSIDTQRRLETAPASISSFGFAAFACQPARYAERWQGRDGQRLDYERCRRPLESVGQSGRAQPAARQ